MRINSILLYHFISYDIVFIWYLYWNHWRQKACRVWHPTEDTRWCALAKAERSFQQICCVFFQGVIDGVGIDVESLRALKKAECKVELVFHWIQSIVVTSILAFLFVSLGLLRKFRKSAVTPSTGVRLLVGVGVTELESQWKLLSWSFDTRGIDCGIMSAPSPILTRAYSELERSLGAWLMTFQSVEGCGRWLVRVAWLLIIEKEWFLVALPSCSTFCVCIFYCGQRGMVKFHDCLKIARIAVPFPYSQARWVYSVGDTPDKSV